MTSVARGARLRGAFDRCRTSIDCHSARKKRHFGPTHRVDRCRRRTVVASAGRIGCGRDDHGAALSPAFVNRSSVGAPAGASRARPVGNCRRRRDFAVCVRAGWSRAQARTRSTVRAHQGSGFDRRATPESDKHNGLLHDCVTSIDRKTFAPSSRTLGFRMSGCWGSKVWRGCSVISSRAGRTSRSGRIC